MFYENLMWYGCSKLYIVCIMYCDVVYFVYYIIYCLHTPDYSVGNVEWEKEKERKNSHSISISITLSP